MTFIVTIISTIPIYYLAGFQGDFMSIIGIVFILGVEASSVAIFVGCMVDKVTKAIEFTPLIFIPQILFAGFFVRISQIPIYLRWAEYLCGVKYAINLMLLVEFSGSF